MRVFWLNGGLQVQPESDVEVEALLVLLQSVVYDRPVENDGQRPTRSKCGEGTGADLMGEVDGGA